MMEPGPERTREWIEVDPAAHDVRGASDRLGAALDFGQAAGK